MPKALENQRPLSDWLPSLERLRRAVGLSAYLPFSIKILTSTMSQEPPFNITPFTAFST